MNRRQYDPVNGVWMRVIPNVGMSFVEWDAAEDEIAVETIMRAPAAQEMIARMAAQRVSLADLMYQEQQDREGGER